MRVVGSGAVEVLLVGGGGGGGVVYTNSIAIREGVWDVTVGAGGEIGKNGNATRIEGLELTAYGGGAGAKGADDNTGTKGYVGGSGASGGGATGNDSFAGSRAGQRAGRGFPLSGHVKGT